MCMCWHVTLKQAYSHPKEINDDSAIFICLIPESYEHYYIIRERSTFLYTCALSTHTLIACIKLYGRSLSLSSCIRQNNKHFSYRNTWRGLSFALKSDALLCWLFLSCATRTRPWCNRLPCDCRSTCNICIQTLVYQI